MMAGPEALCDIPRSESGIDRLLVDLSSSIGILQNNSTPMTIDNPPFLNLIQGSKTADAGTVIV
jgi:hypothetical protein